MKKKRTLDESILSTFKDTVGLNSLSLPER